MTNFQNTPGNSGDWLDELLINFVYDNAITDTEQREVKTPITPLLNQAKTTILAHIQAEVLAGRVEELEYLLVNYRQFSWPGINDSTPTGEIIKKRIANLKADPGKEDTK